MTYAGSILYYPKFKAFDSNGDPLSGGFVYTYEPGTTTAKTTYSDIDLTTANANPVELDSEGEAEIYYSGTLKVILKTSGGTDKWTIDNIPPVEQVTGSGTSGYIAVYNSDSTVSGVSEISGNSVVSMPGSKITGTIGVGTETTSNITGKIYIVNLTGNPFNIAGGKTGTTISGTSCCGGWSKSGTSAQRGPSGHLSEVTSIMTSAVKGMSHVVRILQDTAQSGGTINVLFEKGDNIVSATACIAGTSKYILSGTTNAMKLILTASATSEWEVDEVGSPSVSWD